MADIALDLSTALGAVASITSVVVAARASAHAKGARDSAGRAETVAGEALHMSEKVAENLELHYQRIEISYAASRDATIALLAFLQGTEVTR